MHKCRAKNFTLENEIECMKLELAEKEQLKVQVKTAAAAAATTTTTTITTTTTTVTTITTTTTTTTKKRNYVIFSCTNLSLIPLLRSKS